MSAPGSKADLLVDDHFWRLTDISIAANDRFAPIVLKKSFWGDERKFLEPLAHFASVDVGDHIAPPKIDHRPS
jgi:hypothetical protein